MTEEGQELLERIFSTMTQGAPGGWKTLQITAFGVGAGADFRTKISFFDGSQKSFRLESITASSCVRLRKTMYLPGKGTWYTGRFTVDAPGECAAEYDYDSIPLDPYFEETLEDIRDELIEDQKLFPRDQENLPEWHPSRK
jgi:hypothetical protein